MKVIVKYLSNETEKEVTVEGFKSVYTYGKYVEVKGTSDDGIENSVKIPTEHFVSINITK